MEPFLIRAVKTLKKAYSKQRNGFFSGAMVSCLKDVFKQLTIAPEKKKKSDK